MTVQELANKICGELPEGYQITICMENGSGSIEITDEDGDILMEPSPDGTLEERVLELLEWAKAQAAVLAEYEKANGTWFKCHECGHVGLESAVEDDVFGHGACPECDTILCMTYGLKSKEEAEARKWL